jgi:hypothetical protein
MPQNARATNMLTRRTGARVYGAVNLNAACGHAAHVSNEQCSRVSAASAIAQFNNVQDQAEHIKHRHHSYCKDS